MSNTPKLCHHRVWGKSRSRVQSTAIQNTFLPFRFAHSQISLCVNYLGPQEEKRFLNTVNDWHIKNGQEQGKVLWYRVEVSLCACKHSPWTHLGGSWKKKKSVWTLPLRKCRADVEAVTSEPNVRGGALPDNVFENVTRHLHSPGGTFLWQSCCGLFVPWKQRAAHRL